MIRETQSLIDRKEENSQRRESLIQSEEIDEEEHAVFRLIAELNFEHVEQPDPIQF
jgi:hypothetical protein